MKRLRSGFTTGACATAAAKGAAFMLRDQQVIGEVEITLPRGERARFALQGQRVSATEASCFVVKDAGDDPDITNGAEIHATVSLVQRDSPSPPSNGPHPPPDLPLEGGGIPLNSLPFRGRVRVGVG